MVSHLSVLTPVIRAPVTQVASILPRTQSGRHPFDWMLSAEAQAEGIAIASNERIFDACGSMIPGIGERTGRSDTARSIIEKIHEKHARIEARRRLPTCAAR